MSLISLQEFTQSRDVRLSHLQSLVLGQLPVFADGWNDVPKTIEREVQTLHPPAFPRIRRQPPLLNDNRGWNAVRNVLRAFFSRFPGSSGTLRRGLLGVVHFHALVGPGGGVGGVGEQVGRLPAGVVVVAKVLVAVAEVVGRQVSQRDVLVLRRIGGQSRRWVVHVVRHQEVVVELEGFAEGSFETSVQVVGQKVWTV